MALNLLYLIGLPAVGFLFSTPLFVYANKPAGYEYDIKKDVWIYMWGLTFAGVCLLSHFMPDFNDTIISLKAKSIIIPFALSALIYVIFLLETDWLLYLSIGVSSAVMSYIIPEDAVLFNNLPMYTEKIIVFLFIFWVTFFAKILNGMSAVFAIFVLTILGGVCLISFIGGLPLGFGLICSYIAGLWLGFLRYNWYPSEIYLNDGACTSAGFLIACLFLYCSFEYATGSMLILLAYLFTEILWVTIREYILRIKEPDFYINTSYYVSYTKDISAHAILMALVKIGMINVIFAGFQVYAPNIFSLPLFALIADLWLINMLFHASEEKLSFKQTNQAVINEVKNNLKTIKDTIKSGKK